MSDGGREKVLVLGDDMRIFLSIVRSLGRAGKEVHAVPLNWQSPALNSANELVHRFLLMGNHRSHSNPTIVARTPASQSAAVRW